MLNWVDVNRTFAELDQFRRQMDSVFERALRDELYGSSSERGDRAAGATLETTDEAFILRAELPGVSPEDIELQVTADGLTLRAERRLEQPEGYSVHRQERGSWQVARSWSFPVKVDPDNAHAEVEHGLLTVHLPKAAEMQPRRITVRS